LRIFVLGALCLFSAARAQAQPTVVPLSCATAAQARSIDLPAAGAQLDVRHIASGPAWLEVEEAGQRVKLGNASSEAITIPQPLRFGWHWLPVTADTSVAVQRTEPGSHARATVKVTLHCLLTAKAQEQLAWLQRAGQIGSALDKPDRQHLAATLAAVDALRDDAPTPRERAIALHFAAEALAANSRSGEAIAAFATAEQAWLALNERERALAAHLGRIEGLRSTDAYQAVIDQTPDTATLHGAQTYFSARMENPRCLSLQSLGRLGEAAACFDWLLKNYQALGENTDYIVAAQNYAGVQRDRGDLQAAEEIGARSMAMASGPDAPMLRGRLRLMLADLALRRGQIAKSFAHAELAFREFDSDQFGVAPWRARSLMHMASLYSELGANEEALGALGDALDIIAPLKAAGAMALAMNIFADIETNTGHDGMALLGRRGAEQMYARLGMAPAYQATRATRLMMQARTGDSAGVKRELAGMSAPDPLHAAQPLLLAAELSIREGRFAAARTALDQVAGVPLSLQDQIRIAVLDAEQRHGSGDADRAQRVLRSAAISVDTLAQKAGNQALRYVIARQSSALREAALRLAFEPSRSAHDAATIDTVWQWLVPAASGRPRATAQRSMQSPAEPFDRAVAAELLSQPGRPAAAADASAQRGLLSLLAEPGDAADEQSRASAPSLQALQRWLGADAAFIAFVDADTRGALLWVTHDEARLVAVGAPNQLRSSAIALRELVRSAGVPVADIRASAKELSARLLGAIAVAQPPRHLYVLAEEPLNGIAWSALPWPGHDEPLVESTAVSLVRLSPETAISEQSSARLPRNLRVVVAAQGSESPLRSLAVASVEAAQIRKALGDDGLPVDERSHATPQALLELLDEPAAWVHVAAHGMSRPERIGFAGIWLETPPHEATPAFLGWLDVLDHGVRADLVVLDACQLGDSGPAISGNLSFADAVSRAGARQVVAALWPVSDAASAVWVPAFYRALADDPRHDPAQALRAAQLRLRETRAFVHPFFWAGMQTIERVPLTPGLPATTARTRSSNAKSG